MALKCAKSWEFVGDVKLECSCPNKFWHVKLLHFNLGIAFHHRKLVHFDVGTVFLHWKLLHFDLILCPNATCFNWPNLSFQLRFANHMNSWIFYFQNCEFRASNFYKFQFWYRFNFFIFVVRFCSLTWIM